MLLVACERGGGKARSVPDSTAPVVAAPSTDTAIATTTAAPPSKPICPATGLWSVCSIFERLDRSGLAPIRDSVVATEAPLQTKGLLMKLGRGELELYIYESASA